MAKENRPQEVTSKRKSSEVGSEDARPSAILVETTIGIEESKPTILPPTLGGAAMSAGAGWYSSKKVTALWSINQNRNSWVYISDVGWRRLANASDSGVVALTMLGSHAFEKASIVNAREDVGLIQEIYVW